MDMKITTLDGKEAGSAKLSGENLLGWKDYSVLGIKSLTVRWSSKPAKAPMSRCQTGDLRDAGGRTALWQSTSETKGDVLAGQQVGSFQSKEAAESAFGHIAEWNKDCTSLQQESADVDVAGDADATYWKRTLDDKTGEIVALVRIGKRVSIIVAWSPNIAIRYFIPPPSVSSWPRPGGRVHPEVGAVLRFSTSIQGTSGA